MRPSRGEWQPRGHVKLSPTVSLSAGAYLDQSPVGILRQGFLRVDLFGIRTGVAFQIQSVGASLGICWEHGKATEDLAPDPIVPPQHDELTLNTISAFFSVSFRF